MNTRQQLYPRHNWLKSEVLVFEERGKAEYQEKKPQEANNKLDPESQSPLLWLQEVYKCRHTKYTASNYILSHKNIYIEKKEGECSSAVLALGKKKQGSANLACGLELRENSAATPNIVWPKMLEVVASVLVVVCKQMQQLQTILGLAVHGGEDTSHNALYSKYNACAWPQQCWKSGASGSKIVALSFGYHGTKENVGSCWLKSLTGFKLCATTCNRVCKRTQHETSNNVASVYTALIFMSRESLVLGSACGASSQDEVLKLQPITIKQILSRSVAFIWNEELLVQKSYIYRHLTHHPDDGAFDNTTYQLKQNWLGHTWYYPHIAVFFSQTSFFTFPSKRVRLFSCLVTSPYYTSGLLTLTTAASY